MLATPALYSDRLFMAAVGVYVLSMLLHGAEYAAARTARPVLVGAAGPEGDAPPEPLGRTRSDRLGRMGVALLIGVMYLAPQALSFWLKPAVAVTYATIEAVSGSILPSTAQWLR